MRILFLAGAVALLGGALAWYWYRATPPSMGMDQDDTVLAPWTTIKFRVAGVSAATANQSASGPTTGVNVNLVNTLSRRYPGTQPLYPLPSPTQAADTP